LHCKDPTEQKDEIFKLEERFNSHVGATVKCHACHVMLKQEHHALSAKLLTTQSGSIEKLIWGKSPDDGMSQGMKKVMGVNLDAEEASLSALRKVFDEVPERLKVKDGIKKRRVMDTETKEVGFAAADLAFCSLASAAVDQPESSQFSPIEEDKMPPALTALRDELRKTLAGQRVLEMHGALQRCHAKSCQWRSSSMGRHLGHWGARAAGTMTCASKL
jgi:hypothetical protein